MSMSQYAFLSAGVKTLGMLVIGMAVLLISSKSKNALIPFLASLILSGGMILAQEMTAGSGNVITKILNPFILVANKELFSKVEFTNLFGTPILSYVAAIVCAVVSGGVLILLIMLSARKSTVAIRKKVLRK